MWIRNDHIKNGGKMIVRTLVNNPRGMYSYARLGPTCFYASVRWRERERECVCVCVCVREREREREKGYVCL